MNLGSARGRGSMVEGVGFGVEKLGFKAWAVESSGVLVYGCRRIEPPK